MAVNPVARGLLTVGAISVLGLGLLRAALPGPLHDDRLAVKIIGRLQATRISGAVVRVNDTTLYTRCRRINGAVSSISVAGGQRLIVRRTHLVMPSTARRHPYRTSVFSAEADLAGSRRLYINELVGRLQLGDPVIDGRGRFGGRPVYRLRLGNDRPRVVLLVDQRSLRPLGVSFRSARISGVSHLHTTATKGC
jgi:hypothetical protein